METLTADQMIQRIADVLAQWDSESIAEIACQVLTERIEYVAGSDTFILTKKHEEAPKQDEMPVCEPR